MVILFFLATTLINSHKPPLDCLIIEEYIHLWHPHMKSLKKVIKKSGCIISWTPSKPVRLSDLGTSLQGNQLHLDSPHEHINKAF